MTRISIRTSGLVATAAVHAALAALLLAGWQVSRQMKPPTGPLVLIDRTVPPPVRPDPVVTTTDLPIDAVIDQPVWDEAAEPVVRADPGPADPGPGPLAGGDGEPEVTGPPPLGAGPSRIARLRGAEAMQPPYPPASRALGEEGSVTLAVSIDAEGIVTGVTLLRGSGFARLDTAALDFARRRWRFEPAVRDGVAVPSTRHFTIRFSLATSR